jgi:hypothetical protein
MSSSKLPTDNAMIAMYEKLLNETTEKLKTETNEDNIKTLKKAKLMLDDTLKKLIEVAIYEERRIKNASRPSSGSKTKKGGNKKRRKTRNNRK